MNRVVVRNYKLSRNRSYGDDTPGIFDQMLAVCRASYAENLLGDWEWLTLEGDLSHLPTMRAGYTRMQQLAFDEIRRMCAAGDNVLLVDLDTVCVRPTLIFGEFDRMVVPWGNIVAGAFMLSGSVIYLPTTTSEAAWAAGHAAMNAIPEEHWAGDQDAYNAMVRADGPLILCPALNWNTEFAMGIPESEARIRSFNASRGRARALEEMRAAVAAARVAR